MPAVVAMPPHAQISHVEDDKIYIVPTIVDSLSRPLECWDLHVGATVTILGRKTTLKQVAVTPSTWIAVSSGSVCVVRPPLRVMMPDVVMSLHVSGDSGDKRLD